MFMTDENPGVAPQATGERPPWVLILIFTGLFFAMQHDPFFSIKILEPATASDIAKIIVEGSAARQVVLILLGLFGFYSLLGRNRYQLRLDNGLLGWLLIAFVVWIFLSGIWAEDMKLTLKRSAVFLLFSLGALGVALQFSLDDLIKLVFAGTLAYLFIGILAEIALHTFKPFALEYRFCGTLHPNHQGTNCAFLLLSAVFLMGRLRQFRLFFIAVALAAFLFLCLTKSRTAFVSVIMALVAYRTLSASMSRNMVILWVGSIAFCIFLLAAGDAALKSSKKAILLGRSEEGAVTLTARTKLWKACLGYAARYPVLGYGWGSFWTPQRAARFAGEGGWGIATGHSSYLDTLLALGFIGLFFFLAILLISLWRSWFYYFATGDPGYGFIFAVLTFGILDSFLESALVGQTFLAFLTYTAIIRLGFIEPPLWNRRVTRVPA